MDVELRVELTPRVNDDTAIDDDDRRSINGRRVISGGVKQFAGPANGFRRCRTLPLCVGKDVVGKGSRR